jgi:hypothetical protein
VQILILKKTYILNNIYFITLITLFSKVLIFFLNIPKLLGMVQFIFSNPWRLLGIGFTVVEVYVVSRWLGFRVMISKVFI